MLASCVESHSVLCADDSRCPQGTVCARAPGVTLCVDADRRQLCEGIADGAPCDELHGRCYDGVCAIITCGDRVIDPGVEGSLVAEACDDGNVVNGDGCAADCRSDETCGNGTVDPVAMEVCDDRDTIAHDGCSSRCQLEAPRWTRLRSIAPGARTSPTLAYDAIRNEVVMSGGSDGRAWTWDGHGWLARPSILAPELRANAGAVFDPTLGVLLLGGQFIGLRYFDDVWRWDGSTWSQIDVAPFGPRSQLGVAFDTARGRLVAFGGQRPGAQLADTWEWDGTTWHEIAAAGPGPRAGAAMTYDPVTGRVLLFGGTGPLGELQDLWSWDGATWTELAGTGPSPRARAAMVPYRGSILLHGGEAGTTTYHDTWQWDAQGWVQVSANATNLGAGIAMATDVSRDRVVLVGGGVDTVWEWDGSAWSEPGWRLPPRTDHLAAAFDARRGRAIAAGEGATWELVAGTWRQLFGPAPTATRHAITYDDRRDQVLLFGGVESLTGATNNLWIRDATTWSLLPTPPNVPAPRASPALAFDSARGRAVVFGGEGASALDDTWEWDGTVWTDRSGSVRPSRRHSAAIAYDPVRQRIVMFGGIDGVVIANDTWEWDGTSWEQKSMAGVRPAGRYAAAMGWNPVRGRITLSGGKIDTVNRIEDTWEWDGTTWTPVLSELVPPAAAGHSMIPAGDGRGIVLLGGSITRDFDDTWTLRWEGVTPFERCHVAIDRDGDGLAGCDDPDC